MSVQPDRSDGPCWAEVLRVGSLVVILAGVMARATITLYPFPYWDIDPTRLSAPNVGLGPAWLIGLDVVTLLAAGIGLIGEVWSGRRLGALVWVLAGVGAVPVVLHALVIDGGSLESLRVGSGWVAAIVTGLAVATLSRDDRLRAVAAAAAVAIIGMLAAKGIEQVVFEHPLTVERFRANREAFLAARGWTPDSPMARSFERRLSQADATGWFGLANVYASFAATCFVVLLGFLWLGVRDLRRRGGDAQSGMVGLLGIATAAAGAALALSRSKGGVAAAGVGVLALGVPLLERLPALGKRLARSPARAGGLLALAMPITALGAVVVRGMIGTRLGELSLLFRWFYMRAAAVIFAHEPILGVGPGEFRSAYVLAKPALSPEEVTSPHSLALDWLATLGLPALAWIALLGVGVWRIGGHLAARAEAIEAGDGGEAWSPGARRSVWLLVVIATMPTIAGAWVETQATTPESAIARVLGLVAWIGFGWGILYVARRWTGWERVLAAGALALVVHAMIDVTPVWAGSACWVGLVLGCAGSRRSGPDQRRGKGRNSVLAVLAIPLGLIAGGLALGVGILPGVARWEAGLGRAAGLVKPIARFQARLDSLDDPASGESIEAIARDLGRALGTEPPRNSDQLRDDLSLLAADRTERAGEVLLRAGDAAPRHLGTLKSASRVLLQASVARRWLGQTDQAEALAERASQMARRGVERFPDDSAAWGWLGMVWASIAQQRSDAGGGGPAGPGGAGGAARGGDEGDLGRAIEAWERAAALDPHGLWYPVRIVGAAQTMGDGPTARRWALRALEVDRDLRLDPVRGLSEAQRREFQRIAQTP